MRVALNVLSIVLIVSYPIFVYVGLLRLSSRWVGLVLLAVLVPTQLLRLRKGRLEQHLAHTLPLPVGIGLLLILAAVVDDHRFVLAMPLMINLVLLTTFAWSLRSEMPIVERFARLQVDDLSDLEVVYCRSVTKVWIAFFAVNGLVIAGLVWLAPLEYWAAYTGLISYLMIGLLFTVEYLIRKARFGRFGPELHDRILVRLMGKRSSRQSSP